MMVTAQPVLASLERNSLSSVQTAPILTRLELYANAMLNLTALSPKKSPRVKCRSRYQIISVPSCIRSAYTTNVRHLSWLFASYVSPLRRSFTHLACANTFSPNSNFGFLPHLFSKDPEKHGHWLWLVGLTNFIRSRFPSWDATQTFRMR